MEADFYAFSVSRVIVLNGSNVRKDLKWSLETLKIANRPVWTGGLAGCLAVAIVGTNDKTGKQDLFFGHLRAFQDKDDRTNDTNPLPLTKKHSN